jgi:DNA processing protein
LPLAGARGASHCEKGSLQAREKELAGVQKIANGTLVNWTEPEYPQTLLQIYDPPVLLYVRGDPQILNHPCLSIVGTRRPTLYGTQMAQRLGRELAARGLVIVSGMARGIDAVGHQGAMDANGRAIGVLGTGIDVCYPKENKKLYEKVLERGAIIGEFPRARIPRRKIFRCATASWRACRSAWWWKEHSTAGR